MSKKVNLMKLNIPTEDLSTLTDADMLRLTLFYVGKKFTKFNPHKFVADSAGISVATLNNYLIGKGSIGFTQWVELQRATEMHIIFEWMDAVRNHK